MNRVITFCLSLFCAAWASQAVATVYQFSYQGLPFGTGDPWVYDEPAWTGNLWLDEDLMPGQHLAGGSLGFDVYSEDYSWRYRPGHICEPFPDTAVYCAVYRFQSADGALYTGRVYEGRHPPSGHIATGFSSFGWVDFDGFLDFLFLGYTVYVGQFEWVFDSQGQIEWWSGYNYTGGSGDPNADVFGDCFCDGIPPSYTQGGGTWTRVSPPTASVPLPASGMLGIGALLSLFVATGRQRLRPEERPAMREPTDDPRDIAVDISAMG